MGQRISRAFIPPGATESAGPKTWIFIPSVADASVILTSILILLH